MLPIRKGVLLRIKTNLRNKKEVRPNLLKAISMRRRAGLDEPSEVGEVTWYILSFLTIISAFSKP